MALETKVATKSIDVYDEAQKGAPIRINKIGSPITKSSKDQSVTDGRTFNIQQATPDTLLTGTIAYAATTPGIIFTVPDGVTVLVHEVQVTAEDMAGTDNYVTVGYAPGDLYVSGGLASSVANCLNSSVGKPSMIGDVLNGDTAIVMLDPAEKERIVYNKCWPFADVNTSEPRIALYKPPVPLPLVGKATFFVYIYGTGTACEYQFNLRYTEYATSEII